MRNLITDVAGLKVGNADDARARLRRDRDRVRRAGGRLRATCAAARPARARPTCCGRSETVERIDAIVLSGGSAFGLDAPGGVQAWLREQGRGFAIGPVRVPIVPGAILFDLHQRRRQGLGPLSALSRSRLRGGRERRRTTSRSARAGAGFGATTVNLKGGLGSASAHDARRRDRRRDRRRQRGRQRHGRRRAAFLGGAVRAGRRVRRARPAAVAAARRARDPRSRAARARTPPSRWSRPTRRSPRRRPSASRSWRMTGSRARSIRCTRRSTATSCSRPRPASARSPIRSMAFAELGALAANVLARAVARGVYEATRPALPGRAAGLEGQVWP